MSGTTAHHVPRALEIALAAVIVALTALPALAVQASAASPGPSWRAESRQPTYFAPGGVGTYQVLATNVGTGPAGEITVTDKLPLGVEVAPPRVGVKTIAFEWSAFTAGTDINELVPICSTPSVGEVVCAFPASSFGLAIEPGQTIALVIHVAVSQAASEGPIVNQAIVEGGGTSVSASGQSAINAHPNFGMAGFHIASCGDASAELGLACDAPYTQAGGTPYELTTTVSLSSEVDNIPGPGFESVIPAGEEPKDFAVDLPPGLIADPQAAEACPLTTFDDFTKTCPANTQVGTALLVTGGKASQHPVYNLTPQLGRPAELGIGNVNGVNFVITGSVRTGEDYGLSAISSGIPTITPVTSATVTLWGAPADPSHDPQRGLVCSWAFSPPPMPPFNCEGGGQPNGGRSMAFVRLPTACSGQPLTGDAAADSWQHPGALRSDGSRDRSDPIWRAASGTLAPLTGCRSLAFAPSLELQPDTTAAGEPVGLGVSLVVPQTDDPALLATPHVRSVRVALPMGMPISPSAAQGLTTCNDDPNADPRVSPNELGPKFVSPASCDPSSQVGTVHATSPDLAQPLDGKVFLGDPLCGPCSPADAQGGRMVRLYLQLVGEGSDALTVKLTGYGSIDQQTGQLTTFFSEDPQLPFDRLTLSLGGGPRATLANPRTCGQAETNADLSPWNSPFTADGTPASHFEVTGCVPSQFMPSFTAGATSNQAGAFSPFTLAFGRADADGFFSGAQVRMPPGLLGMLSAVSLCGEPQAALGTCGPQSLIGHAQVLTGPGAEPFLVSGGQVFITGPYRDAPYGLSIVVPAKAGPYSLSGTNGSGYVIARAAINIDPVSAQLIVTADPLPNVLDGIPLQLRVVNVTIDRPNFTFNPTDCNPLELSGTLSSTQGQAGEVSSSFQVTNCAALAFAPKFSASTSARTSRRKGASLDVKLVYPSVAQGTQANIAKVKVSLPRQLPSRLTTLQKACAAAIFQANPADCPRASVVGIARASTPVLPTGLSGPVYFVSHGGQRFPSLIIVLQGDGVRVDLTGATFISKAGVTSSTFRSVPDVPIRSFELYLPQGANSALAAHGSLCGGKLAMPTAFTAQDGAILRQSIPIEVTGCFKPSSVPKRRAVARARHRSTAHKGGQR